MENEKIAELLEKTKNPKVPFKPVTSMPEFLELLLSIGLSDATKEALHLPAEEDFLKLNLDRFDPKRIVGIGTYKTYHDLVLKRYDAIPPYGPYKNLAKLSYTAARYLSRYKDLDDYRNQLNEKTKDEESLLTFLEDFHKNTGLPFYFRKACLLFQKSGLLDVPVVDEEAKKFLMEGTIALSNEDAFRRLLRLAKGIPMTCYELNDRIRQCVA